MTSLVVVFLCVAIAMSIVDWVAVARENSILEYVSKPAATAGFLATAAALDVAHHAPWAWRIAALAFCILGDVFLMLPKDAFVPGLVSFAVGQILFTVSFATGETHLSRLLAGAVILLPIALLLLRRFVRAMRASGHNDLVIPVIVYVVVITAMALAAMSSGNPTGIIGALVFMSSDSLIAESRFVKARSWQPVGIMVTYHVSLAALALSLR